MNYREFLKQAASGNAKPIKLRSGVTQGFVSSKQLEPPTQGLRKRDFIGTDYAVKYKLEEEARQEDYNSPHQMEELEGLTSITGTLPNPDEVFGDQLTQIYDVYQFDQKPNKNLAIHDYKDEILENIESNQVVVIKGATGCGKSTQVPQMILDNARHANIHCNIVVTQPRRIATISVARRVATERGWDLGTLIGYQISLEKKISSDTRLLYCTTGVLLQQLITEQSLSRYTHIVIDEIHERDMETDFLLILIKLFLRNCGCRTRVILMSATVDTEKFTDYFSKKTKDILIEPPVIEVGRGLTNHDVRIYYLEDLEIGKLPMKIPDVKYEESRISVSMMEVAATLVEVFKTIDAKECQGAFIGSVLIFLPGFAEIEEMFDCLMKRKQRNRGGEEWMVRPLHSTVTFDEQVSVFQPPPPNHRKIILATNIAESSITVPDAKYVIDFCLMKYQVQEPDSGFSSLQTGWMSKSQGAQRAGRVGRVMSGRVYRLIRKTLFEILPKDCEPEIKRSSLELPVLKAKQLSLHSPPAKILALAMDPPDLSNICRTILNLKQLGGLSTTINGKYVEDDGELTFVGQVMASLPIDVHLSKLILMGHTFSLLKDAVTIACTMNVRNVFSTPFKQQLEAYNSKIAWADSSCSDPIAYKTAFDVWRRKTADGSFKRSGGLKEKDHLERYFIQKKALNEVSKLEEDVTNRLKSLNIYVQPNSVRWSDMEKPLILKMMIAGAFYPNYFLRRQVDEKEAVKVLGGRDPFNTCLLSGFPLNQPGPLYAQTIKNYFTHCGSDMHVSFDGSSKVYLEFKSSATDIDDVNKPARMPGSIEMALYRAIKLRQLKRIISVPILNHHEANRRWASICKAKSNNKDNLKPNEANKPTNHLPGCTTETLAVNISHKEDPSKFWVQIVDETIQRRLLRLYHLLNDRNSPGLVPLTKPPRIGMILAAPYSENKGDIKKDNNVSYFRAKVKNIGDGNSVQVFFIDYGNTEWLDAKYLMDFHPDLIKINITEDPENALECTLTEVQPSVMSNRNGLWSYNAIAEMDKYFGHYADPMAIAKIYSVVNGVVSVVLFRNPGHNENMSFEFQDSFNYHLIKNGLADRCEEPYLSRENHIMREMAKKRPDLATAFSSCLDDSGDYVPPPKESECDQKIVLKGPKSPLEMQLHCMTQKCMCKNVSIDGGSVNSVLLDTYPMDSHDRVLVAGMVNVTPNGENLILRQTTLMPNIHGLFAIIALIFSPAIELRVDAERTRWTGAVCGLGCDPVSHESYDPENDMEVNFDVTFNFHDLELINKLRFWMNLIVFGGMEWQQEMFRGQDVAEAQEKVKEFIKMILLKKRPSQGVLGNNYNFRWGQIDEKWLMNPINDEEPMGPSLYPLIWGVRLRKTSSLARNEINRNLDKLDGIIIGMQQLRASVNCPICYTSLDNVQAVRFHVSSSMHQEALFEHKNMSVHY